MNFTMTFETIVIEKCHCEMRYKKSPLHVERGFRGEVLPDQDSNLDSTDSESDVLASYTIGQ